MKEIDYREFSQRLHEKASGENKRIPVNATLELTYRCTNRCVHCYCSLPPDHREAINNELSPEEIEDLFYQLKEMGTLWLLLTGGDPLVRDDFKEIYLSAKRHGFIVTVFTNGIMITEEIAELFKKYPPFTVEITMYGAERYTYERITRVKGSYELYWKGVTRLVERGIKLKLKTMALSINRHEIAQMDSIARRLGCHFRFDPLVHKRIDSHNLSTPERYRIPPEDVVLLDMEFPQRLQEFEEFCHRYLGMPSEPRKLLTCGAGRSTIHIMPDGRVLPCSMLLNFAESARERPLQEIWNVRIKEVLEMEKTFSLECDSCRLLNICGQCPGWSFIEYGRMDRKVEYLCRITKARATALSLHE